MKELKYNGKIYKLGQKVRINSGSNIPENNGEIGTIKSFFLDGKETALKGFMEIFLKDGGKVHVYDRYYGEHDVDILEEAQEVEPNPIVFKNGEFTTTDKELAEAMDEMLHKPKEQYLKRFPSGAVRSDSRGKLRVDFISPYALQLLAKHFSKNSDDFNGEEEFGVNYFKGITPKDINPSLTRHWLDVQIALTEGNKEQVKEELTALGANVIMALHQIVLEEKGLYKEEFEGISYIEK